ncbi:cache domain-containing protein [Bradyrhizobium sp. AZCC 1693]|uniref:cache domain-containing protein n=1 Tax=Bradyrhizobium sp. AZCC 1693 TaxID=3117029 RepID=UPI002FEE934D
MASRRFGLRTLVFLGGAILMLIPAVVTANLYIGVLHQRAEQLLVEKLTIRGELSAGLLARRLYALWMDVAKLATTIDTADLPAARDQIQFLSRLDSRYSWLGLADVNGKVLTAKGGMLEGESVAQRPWFRRGLVAPTAIDVHEAQLLARLMPAAPEPYRFIDMAAPLRHNGSTVAGVIGAHINWSWVAEGLAGLQASGIDLLLLSRERVVLFGPPDLINKPLNIGSAQAANRVTSAVLDERWPNGKDYITVTVPAVGYADLPSFGWSLLIRQNLDEALAPTRELIRSFWITLGSGAFVALVLLYIAAKWVTTPLLRLCGFAESIVQAPNSKAPYQETRFDEAARLSDALVRLQSKLMRM